MFIFDFTEKFPIHAKKNLHTESDIYYVKIVKPQEYQIK